MSQDGNRESNLLPPTYLGGPPITGENCEREPIHLPGGIQPHGALLVVQAEAEDSSPEGHSLPVLQASANLGDFLGVGAEAALGQPLAALIGEEQAEAVRLALPPGTPDRLQFRAGLSSRAPEPAPLLLTAHRAGARLMLEVERQDTGQADIQNRLRNAVFALESAATLAELLDVAALAARDLSGFDRVMIYRFAADNSGLVVAEARREDLGPFLGHRFPESDIPAQARALYVRHLLRLTADVDAAPMPLVPLTDPLTHAPTPLGGAVLRATSPMHLQYLRNMGVASSLSVSIVVEGRLWGLISCHHTTPRVTPPEVRAALEELGRLLNLQVHLKELADTAAFRERLAGGHQRVLNTAAQTLSPLAALSDPALGLRELLSAGGLALRLEGEWRTLGETPPHLDDLLGWLREQESGDLFATHHLGSHLGEGWPQAREWKEVASGLLAVSVGRGWREALLWFRPEEKQVAVWGGAVPENAKTDLGPRRSFETYVEQVRGQSRPWHPGEVAEARALGQSLAATLGERLATMRRLNADLTRSNEEWRNFAFVISHDMQEPVRLIQQFIQLFQLQQAGELTPASTKMLDFLSGETSRIGTLVSDLYAYTELLSYPQLSREAVTVSDIVQRSLTDLGELVTRKQLDLQVSDGSGVLHADPGRLTLALTHLLKNALTFGSAPVRVKVHSERVGPQVTIRLSDNGPGIAPEFQERVFGLFQRLAPPGQTGGNGVGLPLARKVAELHGGSLTMTSRLGDGTTLLLTLNDPAPEAQSGGQSEEREEQA